MCQQKNAIFEEESMVIGLDESLGVHLLFRRLSQHVTAKCGTFLCIPYRRLAIGHLHLEVTSKTMGRVHMQESKYANINE